MALFKVRRTIKPGVIPAGLTYGEMAVNLTDRKLYVGGTANNSIEILGGGGGSAESTWTSTEPTTATDIAGIPQGTTIDVGSTAIEILEQILYPYQEVAFTSLTTGLASTYELGQTAGNGSFTVSWNRSGPTGNWIANSAYFRYSGLVTGVGLTAGSPTAASVSVSYPAFRATTIGSNTQTFQLTGQQVDGSNPVSRSSTTRWWSKIYWGKSTNPNLTDRTLLTNGGEATITTATSGSGTISTTDAGGYLYFFIHDYYELDDMKFGGFDVTLVTPVVTASVMNAQGFSTTYKTYRSVYQLPGELSNITIAYSSA
jgi:hypothetical protein